MVGFILGGKGISVLCLEMPALQSHPFSLDRMRASCDYVSYTLNSLKGIIQGTTIEAIEGVSRSLAYSSCPSRGPSCDFVKFLLWNPDLWARKGGVTCFA